jgi:hypothetical protein
MYDCSSQPLSLAYKFTAKEQVLTDALQGYTPGAIPATAGGLAGFLAGEIASNWSQISQRVQNIYQQTRASVPH